MLYDYLGLADGFITVVMSSPGEADRAMHELQGAPLYTKRIGIKLFSDFDVDHESRTTDLGLEYALRWGWYANKSKSPENIRLRYPRTTPPHGIFDAYRESRSVAILRDSTTQHFTESIYELLHTENVLGVRTVRFRTPKRSEGLMCEVRFATKEAAEIVCQFNNNIVWYGSKLRISIRRPPGYTRILGGSREASHNRAHYQPRDLGSAKGTNLEKVSTLLYRCSR